MLKSVMCLIVVSACTPGLAAGQWLHYPTADVPRTPDGTPNLSAPAPRLPDGKPDFAGIWGTATHGGCKPDVAQFVECGSELPGSALAIDIGEGMPGGLPYQPWAAALVKQRVADLHKDDPHARCLPDNPYSSAVWEGDTLVVHTIGFRDGLWLSMSGNPMTDAARMTERMRRPSYGRLDIEVTVDDPKAYTRPWTVSMPMEIRLDTELVDEFCLENEKSSKHLVGAK